jgi:C_GCAxxG_C_C family probable redox protein
MVTIDIGKIRQQAEEYYQNGDYYCSEAIVRTIRDEFALPYPDNVVALASGFPIGIGGSGCTCGALAGGVMALGMAFGRTNPKDPQVQKTMTLAKELHDAFTASHHCACCRVLTRGVEFMSAERKAKCVSLTGEVAEAAARIIAREMAK